jgi:uncharacterized membrane protein YhaH (DUF805 family)
MNWIELFISFEGRIGRKTFWIGTAAVAAAEFVALFVALTGGIVPAEAVLLIFLYPQFAVAVKRGHDRNFPAWIVAGFFAFSLLRDVLIFLGWDVIDVERNPVLIGIGVAFAIYGIVMLVELGFRRGTKGTNRYGADPLGGP